MSTFLCQHKQPILVVHDELYPRIHEWLYDDAVFNDEYTVATASTQSTEAKSIADWEPQDKDSIVQVQTDAEDDSNIGIYQDEVVVTHKEVLPTFDHTHLIYYGDQNIPLPQDAWFELESRATRTATQVVTPGRRASTPALGSIGLHWDRYDTSC